MLRENTINAGHNAPGAPASPASPAFRIADRSPLSSVSGDSDFSFVSRLWHVERYIFVTEKWLREMRQKALQDTKR